jgi:hypothetical protein
VNEQAMSTYRGLLVEVKYRIEAIDAVLANKFHTRARIAEELCYLQLRLICEVIALSCLVIHGDVSAKKKDLLKAYKADWIMNNLERLHPKFYPVPLERDDVPGVDGIPAWSHLTSGFLTKRELTDLYTKTGNDWLHRGSVRNMLKRSSPNFTAIKMWRDKIVTLLTRHIVTSPDEETICYFIMNNGQGDVASNLFKAVKPNFTP